MQQDPSRPATVHRQYTTPPAASSNDYPHFTPQPNLRDFLIRHLFIAFILFMGFIAILGTFVFLIVISVLIQLPEVHINSLSVSNFNVSNNQLTGNWDVNLQFRNPNSKISLDYDSVACFMYYRREFLSKTRFRPFDQKKKDQITPINATLSASRTYVEDRSVVAIGKERAEKEIVEFDLRMISFVTFRYGVFWRLLYVTIHCDKVAVAVPASSCSGKMVDSSKRCKSF